MKNSKIFALLLASMLSSSINAQNTITNNGKTFIDLNKNGKLDLWEDTRLSVDKRIDAIIKQMTNEEKASLLIGIGMPGFTENFQTVGNSVKNKVPGAAGGTFALERFGIPSIIVADGPAGLRINATRENDSKPITQQLFRWELLWLLLGIQI